MAVSKVLLEGNVRWVTSGADKTAILPVSLAELLAVRLDDARAVVEAASDLIDPGQLSVLAPVDEQEVWGAGVTYRRSRDGRAEEATDASIYDRVYDAHRPEVFFKSIASKVVADGEAVGIRADSDWNVPEPELGLVINSRAEIFGYVVGNDMSSRSIEGDNPLYLPQAKVYDRSCALGPSIVPVWDVPATARAISVSILRGGLEVFASMTTTDLIARPLTELVEWLFLATSFPAGVVLLTGTGIVPEKDFTLERDDTVTITIGGVGTLANTVAIVGAAQPEVPTR
ncbi:MAG TPA: fumarylacetoacetate hydrolase family protein [Galbitalea sp.]|jgi:2-dehydro-3-deoxy-D-arabinonate dehydratase|nr:fumarylacetoacetate hydrolase family protein [Galbitalea sp.]